MKHDKEELAGLLASVFIANVQSAAIEANKELSRVEEVMRAQAEELSKDSTLVFWVARDKDNTLWSYTKKPIRKFSYVWNNTKNSRSFKIPNNFFPQVTFENSPQKVKIELCSKNSK